MAFKFEGKNVPHLCFRKCCWSIHSKVVRLDKDAHSKQRKATLQNSAVSRQVHVHALLVQHLYSQWWDSSFLKERVLSLKDSLTTGSPIITWEPLT